MDVLHTSFCGKFRNSTPSSPHTCARHTASAVYTLMPFMLKDLSGGGRWGVQEVGQGPHCRCQAQPSRPRGGGGGECNRWVRARTARCVPSSAQQGGAEVLLLPLTRQTRRDSASASRPRPGRPGRRRGPWRRRRRRGWSCRGSRSTPGGVGARFGIGDDVRRRRGEAWRKGKEGGRGRGKLDGEAWAC